MHSHQTLFSGPPGDSVSYFTISNEASKDAPGGYAPPAQGSKPRKKTEMGGGWIRGSNIIGKKNPQDYSG